MPSFIAAGSGRVVGVRRGITDFERRLSVGVAPSLALAAATLLVCPVAEAHFKINMPMSFMSQDTMGGPQKGGPCAAVANTAVGDSPGTPTKMITVFQAGQTIPISVTATIAHPGWWRVALVQGASSSQSLTTLPDPVAQAGTNCTPAIMANPVWSPTQPIVADGLPAGSVASTMQMGTLTLQVKLPANANCTNASPCTLQVIMVMTDHPKTACYYHHCADIALGSSTDGGAAPATDAAASTDGGRDAGGTGGSNATGTGGFAGTGGGPGSGTGGLPGTGGLSGTGGFSGSGGSVGTGGSPGSGGTLASSGGAGPSSASTGGVLGSGSGGSGTTGPGTTSQSGSGSSGGCSLASGGKSSSAGVSAAGLVALALMLRRRRPRS